MRVRRNKGIIVVLAPIVALVLGIFGSSSIPSFLEPAGSARLVSIEPLPDVGEMCTLEHISVNSNLIASSAETNLFASLEERPVYAASQDTGQTTDVTRPPLRNILDTDPIY